MTRPIGKGAVARCSLGYLGLITSDKPEPVQYDNSPEQTPAWRGISLDPRNIGQAWTSRNPTLVGYIDEILEENSATNFRMQIMTQQHSEQSLQLINLAGKVRGDGLDLLLQIFAPLPERVWYDANVRVQRREDSVLFANWFVSTEPSEK